MTVPTLRKYYHAELSRGAAKVEAKLVTNLLTIANGKGIEGDHICVAVPFWLVAIFAGTEQKQRRQGVPAISAPPPRVPSRRATARDAFGQSGNELYADGWHVRLRYNKPALNSSKVKQTLTLHVRGSASAKRKFEMRDIDIRQALLGRLLQAHKKDNDTKIVQEMGVWAGTVRIDVAVLNGEMSGYELKSDSDTLTRLPLQADLYSKVFDRMTLVVGSKHLDKAVALIPSWWGIISATVSESGVKLRRVRTSRRNVNHEPYLVAELLRKDEAIVLLDQYGLAAGWRSKRVKLIHERLAREIPVRELSKRVLCALKNRQDWLRQNSMQQLDVAVDA